ncbi:MAG: hypothetical protein H0T42_28285 [Deltaproteobacteria bacterium]|nr:hypothetical protein [Deltaproteobacteria bacterium]
MGAVVFVLMGTGCGLIDSDVTSFDLTLPDKKFTIDASGWQVDQAAAMTFLNRSCPSMPPTCAEAAMLACGPDECTGSCNASTQRCELALEVSLYQAIDLLMEKPELKSIDDQPVIKVTLESVTYEVTSNTLNVATPVMTIYVAPISVMEPTDPLAKAIGTIPAVAANTTISTPAPITFTTTGKADLINAMNTFKTPFNIIVGSTLVVQQGQPVPAGKLDAVVHIKGQAGL